MDSILDIARWQFGIIDRLPLPVRPAHDRAHRPGRGDGDALAAHQEPGLAPADQVLRQADADQLRDRRGHRHRAGVPVRDELVGLLPLRRRRLRRAAGGRGAAGVLPGVDVPRALDLRLGQAAARPARRLHVAGPPRHPGQRLVHPGRELVDAAPGRLRVQPRHRPRRAHRLLGGDVQQGAAGDVPARDLRGVHDRRPRSSLGVSAWLYVSKKHQQDRDLYRKGIRFGAWIVLVAGIARRPSAATPRPRS